MAHIYHMCDAKFPTGLIGLFSVHYKAPNEHISYLDIMKVNSSFHVAKKNGEVMIMYIID